MTDEKRDIDRKDSLRWCRLFFEGYLDELLLEYISESDGETTSRQGAIEFADHLCIGQVVYFPHNEVASIAETLLKAHTAWDGSRYAMLLELALLEIIKIFLHEWSIAKYARVHTFAPE